MMQEEDETTAFGTAVTPPPTATTGKVEPLEIEGKNGDGRDLESLLSSSSSEESSENGEASVEGAPSSLHALQGPPREYLNGMIKAQPIGNMLILFPEYFHASGWGVLGPHWIGPTCVWIILVVVTHFCIRKAATIGIGSVLVCYLFFGWSTYLLTDVSLRDPGICLHKAIPETVDPGQARLWRWCDVCQVYQPPDGAHCPESNVCIAGYDHYCVWMGTCIGKRNYQQFVRFNVSWLYYLGYVLLWLLAVGPFMFGS